MNTLTSPVNLIEPINTLSPWMKATWEDYLTHRDYSPDERIKLYFYKNRLLVEMGKEGINHASISDLFTMLLFVWFSRHPEQSLNTFSRCLLEKPKKRAASPDVVVYVGKDYPKWQPGESRYLNLEKWRVPDLVGEISDTTLPSDLDQKKHLYADLGIPEYWVIDVQAKRVFAFQLEKTGRYQECEISLALKGLPINLLEQTIARLEEETNSAAASWFAEQIANIKSENGDDQ